MAEMVTLFGNLEHRGFPVELAITVLEDGDVWIGSTATLVDAPSLNAFCTRCAHISCTFLFFIKITALQGEFAYATYLDLQK